MDSGEFSVSFTYSLHRLQLLRLETRTFHTFRNRLYVGINRSSPPEPPDPPDPPDAPRSAPGPTYFPPVKTLSLPSPITAPESE
ncbi:hypothetical protein AALP_AAs67532U000500 [Arabis alpina]|uniref:Uncharacterized protein n=1 Tax=Arabis alpina TaxID=50452 RepID=A0A087G3Y3_ARAAL|nr:hypothetical protein AALP_AAs67532U000500 [Arabis alpina]